MNPILFDKTATTFTTNGIGRLNPISCVVTEERNGIFELEMVILETENHVSDITMSSIIVAKPNQTSSNQAFRVYKITKPINGKITVYAQHISYQLSYIPTMPFTILATNSACSQTLSALKNNAAESCPFTFTTDVTTVASYSQSVPASIRSRLGGTEGSVLDRFGGEFEWNNYTVTLHKNRGLTTPTVSLAYGKNITDFSQEEYISNTITGVVPFWIDPDGNNLVTLPEKSVDSTYAAQYPFKRTVPLDCSQSFDSQPTEAQLRTYATAYVNQSGIGIPTVSIKVSFLNLADTAEYKDIAALQSVSLCDSVNVYFDKLDISTTAKVVKTTFDCLAEKYNSIEIGSVKTSLAETISSQSGAITAALDKALYATQNATAWLTSSGGYVVAVKNTDGSWKELLFLDTNDVDTATNVLRINENGIGFSSNGVNGPYTQAWTIDGRLVIGGTNVPSITVHDNNDNIIFQADATAMIWNATNSSMDSDGTLNMKNGTIEESEDYGYGKRVMRITTNGITFEYIENNVVKSSSSLLVSVVYGYEGIQLSSTSNLGISSGRDICLVADRFISLESDSNLLIDCSNIELVRNNLANVTGYTGTFSFYDYQENLRQIDIYKGIIYSIT